MATLRLVHRGETPVHEIPVCEWERVDLDGAPGPVEASAVGGNVLLRFDSPGPDFSDEVPVHDGETRSVELSGQVYARAFADRPVGDF